MRKQNSIIRILILVFAVLIALLVIGGGIYLFSASKQLKSIALQPEFPETSLEVGTQYAFTISTQPSKASIKKAKAVVDDPTCSFEINDDGQAILTTGMSEGTVTVYIECKDIKSQVLTFSIVDSVARAQAEAAAQAEEQKKAEEAAAAAAEAEAAAQAAKKYVKATGDDVNVRSTNSTDGDVLGKVKKGEMFEKVEDVDDWTHIKYKDQDGYIKSEFVTEISEEEFQEGPTAEEDKKEEKKEEEKKTDTQSEEDKKKAEEAKAAEEAAKAAADAAKAAEEAAAAQAALAAAAAAQSYELLGVQMNAQEYQYVLDKVKYATPNGTNEEARQYHLEHHKSADIMTLLIAGGYRNP